jgi:hypothetical protein
VRTDDERIDSAQALLNPRMVGDRLFGDVASTLVTNWFDFGSIPAEGTILSSGAEPPRAAPMSLSSSAILL